MATPSPTTIPAEQASSQAPGCLTERMDRYAQRFDGIDKQPHGDTIRRWREQVAELEVIRDLAIEAWSKLGPTGYFPSMGAPLSDRMRNALAKHAPAIKPIDRNAIFDKAMKS